LSPQPIALTEVSTGRLIDVNDEFCKVTEYTREDVIGQTAAPLFYPQEDRDRFIRELQESGEVRGLEMEFRAKYGSIIITLMFSRLVRIADETLILTVFLDVTDRKRLEAQFLQAQKMEAIGTLAGGIAHDFNNLLMGIQGNISLMLMSMDPSYPDYGRLENIEKQIHSGARLTSRLLGYARKGKYEVKPIDLNQLVRETSDTFGRTKKEMTIHQELTEDLFAVEADPGQIEQVLFNLYVNAADAMPGGGKLILKTMNATHKDMKGKLYEPKPGKYVLLTVTDTGTGMYQKIMGRIFDPFFTTKEIGGGTGLGLASAYGIIKAHGGYIDVASKRGRGTTFSIYLPASEKEVKRVVRTRGRVAQGTANVLLVDDEEVVLEVGQELLEAMGYQVLTAKDGKEAITVYKKNRDKIDIVVLDMVMPRMGGGKAYDRMKEVNPDVKVLLSSGFSIDGEASEILERGCDGFIQKPFTMKQLSGKIGEILDKE
jgi:PAS domain S-box-containing protein